MFLFSSDKYVHRVFSIWRIFGIAAADAIRPVDPDDVGAESLDPLAQLGSAGTVELDRDPGPVDATFAKHVDDVVVPGSRRGPRATQPSK